MIAHTLGSYRLMVTICNSFFQRAIGCTQKSVWTVLSVRAIFQNVEILWDRENKHRWDAIIRVGRTPEKNRRAE